MAASGLPEVTLCVPSGSTLCKFLGLTTCKTHVEVGAVDGPTVTVSPVPACLQGGLCWAGRCAQGAISWECGVLNLAPFR